MGLRSCEHCWRPLPEDAHFNRRFCNPACRYGKYGPTARAATKKWRETNRERAEYLDLDKHLKRKFGISAEIYHKMLADQDGRCAICRRTPEEVSDKGAHRLAVDHCHVTGEVRKLLCRPCNTAIGQLSEDPEVVWRAALYLEEHR